jgi:hypothetical protein
MIILKRTLVLMNIFILLWFNQSLLLFFPYYTATLAYLAADYSELMQRKVKFILSISYLLSRFILVILLYYISGESSNRKCPMCGQSTK